MAIKITGQSVFMDFEHVAETDKAAEKFIKGMLKINRDLTLMENPKPERTHARLRPRYRWMRFSVDLHQNPKLDTWRAVNKRYRLTIKIERL